MSFTSIRIHQQDYKRAAADIQRNFDEITKRLLGIVKPLFIKADKISLLTDISLAVDGQGRLYVDGDTTYYLINGSNGLLRWYSDNSGATVKLQRKVNGNWVDTGTEFG
jgi:hypothetical protein